ESARNQPLCARPSRFPSPDAVTLAKRRRLFVRTFGLRKRVARYAPSRLPPAGWPSAPPLRPVREYPADQPPVPKRGLAGPRTFHPPRPRRRPRRRPRSRLPKDGLVRPRPPGVLHRSVLGAAHRGTARGPSQAPARFDQRATGYIPTAAGAEVDHGVAETASEHVRPDLPARRWNRGQKSDAPTWTGWHPGWWIETMSRRPDHSWCPTLTHPGPFNENTARPVCLDQSGGVTDLGLRLLLRLW